MSIISVASKAIAQEVSVLKVQRAVDLVLEAMDQMTVALEKIDEGHICYKSTCAVCSAIIDLDFELRGIGGSEW